MHTFSYLKHTFVVNLLKPNHVVDINIFLLFHSTKNKDEILVVSLKTEFSFSCLPQTSRRARDSQSSAGFSPAACIWGVVLVGRFAVITAGSGRLISRGCRLNLPPPPAFTQDSHIPCCTTSVAAIFPLLTSALLILTFSPWKHTILLNFNLLAKIYTIWTQCH